jgi:hypothetical protein
VENKLVMCMDHMQGKSAWRPGGEREGSVIQQHSGSVHRHDKSSSPDALIKQSGQSVYV